MDLRFLLLSDSNSDCVIRDFVEVLLYLSGSLKDCGMVFQILG